MILNNETKAILQMTATLENSDTELHFNYAENLHDGRGITFGCIGFCTGTYDGNILIKHYTILNPNNILAKYIPALNAIDAAPHTSADGDGNPSTTGLGNFITDVENCTDPLFKTAQLDMLEEIYYDPAMELAESIGAQYALTRAFIYDMSIRHGVDGAEYIIRQAGTTPLNGANEKTYLQKLFYLRDNELENEGLGDVDRNQGYKNVLNSGNVNLTTPFIFVAYGDQFTIDGNLNVGENMVLTINKTASTPKTSSMTVNDGDKLAFSLSLMNSAVGDWALFFGDYPVVPLAKNSNTFSGSFLFNEGENVTLEVVFAVYPVGYAVTGEVDYSKADSYQKWTISIGSDTPTNPDVIQIVDFNPKESNIDINDSVTFSVAVNKACSIVWKLNGSTKYSGSIGASNLFSEFTQTFAAAGTYNVEAICTENSVTASHTWNITLEDTTPTPDVLKITPVSPSKTTFNVGESVGFSIITNNLCDINWYKNNILQKSSVGVTTGTFMTAFLEAGNNVIKVDANDGITTKSFTWNITIATVNTNPTDDGNSSTLLLIGLVGVAGVAALSMMKKQTEYKKAWTE